MSDPKKHPDYDPEWEQERPIWEAYQRGDITDDDFITLEEYLDENPEIRALMKTQQQRTSEGEDD